MDGRARCGPASSDQDIRDVGSRRPGLTGVGRRAGTHPARARISHWRKLAERIRHFGLSPPRIFDPSRQAIAENCSTFWYHNSEKGTHYMVVATQTLPPVDTERLRLRCAEERDAISLASLTSRPSADAWPPGRCRTRRHGVGPHLRRAYGGGRAPVSAAGRRTARRWCRDGLDQHLLARQALRRPA